MRAALLMPLLGAAAVVVASAPAVAAAPTITVTTSLGPIADDGKRDLRARGTAPRGSTLVVTFFRKDRLLGRERPKLRGRRFSTAYAIDRTGSYRVRVTARTRTGERLRVTARLDYGPKAQARVPPPPPPPPE